MYKSVFLRTARAAAPLATRRLAFSTFVNRAPQSSLVAVPRLRSLQQAGFQRRNYTPLSTDQPAKDYDYERVKKVVKGGEPGTVLVDVREPGEYELGHIPTAVNIPFKSSPGALGLEEEEFLDTFGFEKPSTDKNLVFYCLAGIRSTNAENLAATFGYQTRGNYKGSYEDWVNHEQGKESS